MQQVCINQQTYIKSKRVVVVEKPLHLPVLFQDILQLSLSKANSSDTRSTFMLPPNHVGTWSPLILHRIYLLSLKVTTSSPFRCHLIFLHITTWSPFILPPDLRSCTWSPFCHLISIHSATWSPFILPPDLPSFFHLISICHLISLHFATWPPLMLPPDLPEDCHLSSCISLPDLPSCCHIISLYVVIYIPPFSLRAITSYSQMEDWRTENDWTRLHLLPISHLHPLWLLHVLFWIYLVY